MPDAEFRAAVTEALAAVERAVRPLYGPHGGDVLIVRDGAAIVTNAAPAVLSKIKSATGEIGGDEASCMRIVKRWVIDIIERHANTIGDGGGGLALMLHAGWQSAMRLVDSGHTNKHLHGHDRHRRRYCHQEILLNPADKRMCSFLSRILVQLPSTVVAEALREGTVPAVFPSEELHVPTTRTVPAPGDSSKRALQACVAHTTVRAVIRTAIGSALGSEISNTLATLLADWLCGTTEDACSVNQDNSEGGDDDTAYSDMSGEIGRAVAQNVTEMHKENAEKKIKKNRKEKSGVELAALRAAVLWSTEHFESLVVARPGAALSESIVLEEGDLLLPRPFASEHYHYLEKHRVEQEMLGSSKINPSSDAVISGFMVVRGCLEPSFGGAAVHAAAAASDMRFFDRNRFAEIGEAVDGIPAYVRYQSHRPRRLREIVATLARWHVKDPGAGVRHGCCGSGHNLDDVSRISDVSLLHSYNPRSIARSKTQPPSVKLVLCTEGLADPLPQLLAEVGIQAVQLLEASDAALLCLVAGCRPIDAHLLLHASLRQGRSDGDEIDDGNIRVQERNVGNRLPHIGSFSKASQAIVGGKAFVRVCVVPDSFSSSLAVSSSLTRVMGHQRRQLVLRAASEVHVTEYVKVVARALRVTDAWLRNTPQRHCNESDGDDENYRCHYTDVTEDTGNLVGGGGAWELLLHRRLLRAATNITDGRPSLHTCRSSKGGYSTSLLSSLETRWGGQRTAAILEGVPKASVALAMRVLADAVAAAPKALLVNLLGGTPTVRRQSKPHQAWHAVLTALKAFDGATMEHVPISGAAAAQVALSIPLSNISTSPGLLVNPRGGEGGVSLRDAISGGVAHPASSAHATVAVLCNTLAALLRIDSMVRCGAGGGLFRNVKGARSARKKCLLIRRGGKLDSGSGSDTGAPHSPHSSDDES